MRMKNQPMARGGWMLRILTEETEERGKPLLSSIRLKGENLWVASRAHPWSALLGDGVDIMVYDSEHLMTPEFSGLEVCSTVVFNTVEQSSVAMEDDEGSELKGPVIDRRCTRCNKEGMIYHTRQMRSADEGQTVFFTCIHCRYQEKEDS